MIHIVQATENDLSLIRDIAHQTWPDTFGTILSSTQITYMLDMMYSPTALWKQVNESGHVFLLAKDDDTSDCSGFASYEADYKGNALTKIHKIYLLPGSQGKGVGRLLIDNVADRARRHGNNRLGLNVNRFNKAIQFYERMGFAVVGQETIDIGDGFLMDDFVMEKPL